MTRPTRTMPPTANEPVWQASGEADATAIVSALRAEGIPATLKRVGDVQRAGGGSSYFTATVYVPGKQAVEARRILRDRGEAHNVVDMEAFRGYGARGGRGMTIALAVIGAIVVLIAALALTGTL